MVTGMWKFFRGLDEEKAGKDRGGGEGCSIGKLVELDVRSLVVLGGSRSSFIEFDKVG